MLMFRCGRLNPTSQTKLCAPTCRSSLRPKSYFPRNTPNSFRLFAVNSTSLVLVPLAPFSAQANTIPSSTPNLTSSSCHSSTSPFSSLSSQPTASPIDLVSQDFDALKQNVLNHVETKHPLLLQIASYYLSLPGKGLRPGVVFLISRAIASHQKQKETNQKSEEVQGLVSPRQAQLAEIVELIHTASLIHDDVLDEASTRRGKKSVNRVFSAKKAILAGDFLLARASICLSRLRNFDVTEALSTSIADLVEGEFMQLKKGKMTGATQNEDPLKLNVEKLSEDNWGSEWESYLRKTYLKTGSLICNGCRSAALLAEAGDDIVVAATEYGKNFGIAFQLVDDLLDVVGNESSLGKPVMSDLKQGIVTAPLLFAAQESDEVRQLIDRGFKDSNDEERAYNLLQQSDGIMKTRKLAASFVEKAISAISFLNPSPEKNALRDLALEILSREK